MLKVTLPVVPVRTRVTALLALEPSGTVSVEGGELKRNAVRGYGGDGSDGRGGSSIAAAVRQKDNAGKSNWKKKARFHVNVLLSVQTPNGPC